MATRKIEISELNSVIRDFFQQFQQDEMILLEENGDPRFGIIPYRVASQSEQKQAWNDIKTIQQKVGKMMQRTGKTEEEFDEILQDD